MNSQHANTNLKCYFVKKSQFLAVVLKISEKLILIKFRFGMANPVYTSIVNLK